MIGSVETELKELYSKRVVSVKRHTKQTRPSLGSFESFNLKYWGLGCVAPGTQQSAGSKGGASEGEVSVMRHTKQPILSIDVFFKY